MRAVLGFLALHAGLVLVGLALLRALRLAPIRLSVLGVLSTIGPAFVLGVCAVIPVQIVLLVIGFPLTPLTSIVVGVAWVGVAATIVVVTDRDRAIASLDAGSSASRPERVAQRIAGVVAVAAAVYLALGSWATARLPTVLDDARIWSLRGLTLTYYHQLAPAIFQNQSQSGGHPVYPLLQPALEAIMSQSIGSPQLQLIHTELWLLLGAVLWTAAYLLARQAREAAEWPLWLVALALPALTPAVVLNVSMGYADITASALLGAGVLALALWIDGRSKAHLALGALLLAAAASGKDEDLLATVLVLVAVGLVVLSELRDGGTRRWLGDRGLPLLVAVAYVAVIVLPWRVWTSAHHLTEGVEPPLPRALTPSFLAGRGHEFTLTATAMLTQTLDEFGWLAAVFLVACVACLACGRGRRTAAFYLVSLVLVIAALLWLYTTTSEPLSFLIPTSMNRTVDVFMVPAALGTAHLLALLTRAPELRRARAANELI
jgi:hypothetical protein